MPNWVEHDFNITGPAAELERFLACFIKAEGGEFFPQYFADKFNNGQPVQRPTGELYFSFGKLTPRPIDSDIWVLARWGIPDVACDTKIERLPEGITLSFDKRYSLGLTIFEELADLFPLLTIEGEILELMNQFGGHVRCHAGKFDFEDKTEQIRAELDEFHAKLDRERAGMATASDPHPGDEDIPF